MEQNKKKSATQIIKTGTKEEKKALFSFTNATSLENIYKKYILFSRSNYPRYFKHPSKPFHKKRTLWMIDSYIKGKTFMDIEFRGGGKTSDTKLFTTFVILNDIDHRRKYMKVLSRDHDNAVQSVTDIYNMIIEVKHIYGDIFQQEGKIKREERQNSFTTKDNVKLTAGTVGKKQRGHIQDAYRPDWIWFDDIEDKDSIQSDVITEAIIRRVDEAIQGLSDDGSWICTANYISDIGVIENLKEKADNVLIQPILENDTSVWPERFPDEKIAKIKSTAEDWFGDYMCDPITGNKREFKRDLFKFVDYSEVEKLDTLTWISIDSAVKDNEDADYTGITVNYVSKENKWYVKVWREHLDSKKLVERLFELYEVYKPEKIGIEETTFTQAIKPFLDQEMRKRNKFLPIEMLKHGGTNKNVRIRGLLPRYESGSIFHIKGETRDLEAEMLRFPSSKNDDAMDSLAYQVFLAKPPYEKSSLYEDEYDYEEDMLYPDIGI